MILQHVMLVIFFIFFTNCPCVKSYDLNEVELVKNYVKKQEIPLRVKFYTCWMKQKSFEFLKNLAKSEIFTTVETNFSKFVETKSPQPTLIISDSKCEKFRLLLKMGEEAELFKLPYKWLIINYNQGNPVPITTKILIDSHFVVATKDTHNKFQLKLIYKYHENDTSFVCNDLGKFIENFFEYYNPFSVAINRSNLMESTITVSYVLTKPEYKFDVTDYRNRHIDSVSKLSYILVFLMLETLNCTMKFIERDSWGYKAKNNSIYYNGGMLGDLQNGTAEIGGTASFYVLSRLEVIDYVSAVTPTDMKFILRAPPLSYIENLFTLPFQVNVWYSLYAITGIVTLSLYIIVFCESRYENVLKKENNIENIKPRFFDVVMVQIGAITQQGSDVEPKSIAGRIAIFFIFLVLMFLYTAYSANIVVLLQSPSHSINTVQDLLDSKIALGVEDIVYSKHYFESQTEPVRKAIYENKIAPKGKEANFMNVYDGIEKIHYEFFGFHCETTSGYKVIMDTFQEHEKCGLIEIDYLNTLRPSISVRKHSPFTKIIKIGFRKLLESGVQNRHVNRIYIKKPPCGGKGGNFASVGIVDAYFSFVIFTIGVLFSLFLLLMEILFKKYIYDRCIISLMMPT